MTAVTCDLWSFLPQHITINHCQHNYWTSFWIARGFPPPGQILVQSLTVWSLMHFSHNRCIWEATAPTKKSDVFIFVQWACRVFWRPDTVLLLLLLSGKGTAPLLDASLLTILPWAELKSLVDRFHSAHLDDSQAQWSDFWCHTPKTVQKRQI